MCFYGKSPIFLILQEKPGKLKNITISPDINTIVLISTRLIMSVSIHFHTAGRIMDLLQSAFSTQKSLTFKALCRFVKQCFTIQPVNLLYEVASWSTAAKSVFIAILFCPAKTKSPRMSYRRDLNPL